MSGAVYLSAIYMNAANDLDDRETFDNVKDFRVGQVKDGEVRKLANGRRRAVNRAGRSTTYELELEMCDRNQIAWLEDHIGKTVCVRDDRGRKVYGVYFEVGITELVPRSEFGDVAVNIESVTFSEAMEN